MASIATRKINLDPIIVDRYEIVKGPNAILSPAGVPGGRLTCYQRNPCSVILASFPAKVGRFDGDRIETDINRGLGEKLTLRLMRRAKTQKAMSRE